MERMKFSLNQILAVLGFFITWWTVWKFAQPAFGLEGPIAWIVKMLSSIVVSTGIYYGLKKISERN